MFGAIVIMELKHDTRDLLFRINEQLKLQGISHFNKIDGNKLRGYGDAGMGVFEMERKQDRDLIYKLFIDANSPSSAQILENIVLNTFDVMEEEGYEESLLFESQPAVSNVHAKDCSSGAHTLEFIKEEQFFEIPVKIYCCKECRKIEMYKNERSDTIEE